MKVLVTGCNGVLGYNMVNYLLETGDFEIIGLDISDGLKEHRDKITFIKGDIGSKDTVHKALEGVDIIVHTASASPAFDERTIYKIVVDGTRNLLEGAYEKKVKRFIHISSTAVYGIPKTVPMTEETETQPFHDPYNISKFHAEGVCTEFRAKGMCIPILRPRTFLGPRRLGTFAMLFEWAKEGRNFPMLGKGINRYQFLDVEDLCQSIYLAMVKPAQDANDTFNIGAKHFDSMLETYQAVLDEAGYGKKIIPLPAAPILFALRFLEMFRLSPLYKRLYEKLQMDYYVSIEKAEQKLGFKPKYSNSETLVRCYRWYLEQYEHLQTKNGSGNNAPWNQGILKLGKMFF